MGWRMSTRTQLYVPSPMARHVPAARWLGRLGAELGRGKTFATLLSSTVGPAPGAASAMTATPKSTNAVAASTRAARFDRVACTGATAS
jgi:hypothetical protein